MDYGTNYDVNNCMFYLFLRIQQSNRMTKKTSPLTKEFRTALAVISVVMIVALVRFSTLPCIRSSGYTASMFYTTLNGAAISITPVSNRSILRTSTKPVDILDESPELPSVNKSGRYVSLCSKNFDTRRIGNQIFNFAAMLHVARLTGRRVAMVVKHPDGWLDRLFDVPITRVESVERELCPCTTINERRGLAYEQSMTLLPNRTDIVGKSLLLRGWFQSWKYTIGVESQLRRHLRSKSQYSTAVRLYFNSSRPYRWIEERSPTRVAIHVRVGDIQSKSGLNFGYTIPKAPFFELAMANITRGATGSNDGIRRYQFFVLSDSIDWVQTTLGLTAMGASLNSSSVDVEVTYSVGNTAAFDLVLISMCDVVIMTTGTYGWWGAWLANSSKTIYYKNWPRPGSELRRAFEGVDYFPSNWIPIDGPYYEY